MNATGNILQHEHELVEDYLMADGDPSMIRVLDKLDQLQANQAAMMADVARVQGTQQGIQLAIATVSAAVGDVTETRIAASATAERLNALSKRIDQLESQRDTTELKAWVEPLVKWAVAGLSGGGLILAGQRLFG